MAPPASLIQYYDQTVYRSFASIPIKLVNTEKQPFGVLVATSDRVDRFNKANCLILNYLASAVKSILDDGKEMTDYILAHAPGK